MFKAQYICRQLGVIRDEYWRTIHAYNINEAVRMAERYARKGYICAKVVADGFMNT